jgi:hypothetical protein
MNLGDVLEGKGNVIGLGGDGSHLPRHCQLRAKHIDWETHPSARGQKLEVYEPEESEEARRARIRAENKAIYEYAEERRAATFKKLREAKEFDKMNPGSNRLETLLDDDEDALILHYNLYVDPVTRFLKDRDAWLNKGVDPLDKLGNAPLPASLRPQSAQWQTQSTTCH